MVFGGNSTKHVGTMKDDDDDDYNHNNCYYYYYYYYCYDYYYYYYDYYYYYYLPIYLSIYGDMYNLHPRPRAEGAYVHPRRIGAALQMPLSCGEGV